MTEKPQDNILDDPKAWLKLYAESLRRCTAYSSQALSRCCKGPFSLCMQCGEPCLQIVMATCSIPASKPRSTIVTSQCMLRYADL